MQSSSTDSSAKTEAGGNEKFTPSGRTQPVSNIETIGTFTNSDAVGENNENARPDLPPVDQGWPAWRFLLGAFIIEALLWGFLLTFGVFQDYYYTHPPLAGNKNIPWIGVLSTGVLFLGTPFGTFVSKIHPHWQQPMIYLGWLMCIGALIAASFCRSLATLAVTQGVMYGAGFVILYCPILSMLNQWFIGRRGLAYGILFGATGISGVVLPFVITAILKKYGYRTTLRAVAVALVCLSGPALPVLRRRLPMSPGPGPRGKDHEWLRMPLFYVFAVSNLFQGFAFYLPFIYLPSYTTALGYSSSKGAMLLALANAAQVIGQTAYGRLSDKMDIHILLSLSSGVAAVSTLTLWGLGKSLGPIAVFSMLYGSFGGGFVVLWPRITLLLSDDPMTVQTIYGILAFEKGIGNVCSGPISSALIIKALDNASFGLAKFEGIILFTGICMAISSLGGLGRFLRTK